MMQEWVYSVLSNGIWNDYNVTVRQRYSDYSLCYFKLPVAENASLEILKATTHF